MTAKARITYFKGKFLEVPSQRAPYSSVFDSLNIVMQVGIQHDKWDEWTTCFAIENVELPASPFLGFTAHTGDVSGLFCSSARGQELHSAKF